MKKVPAVLVSLVLLVGTAAPLHALASYSGYGNRYGVEYPRDYADEMCTSSGCSVDSWGRSEYARLPELPDYEEPPQPSFWVRLRFWDREEAPRRRTVAILGDSLGRSVGATSSQDTLEGYLERHMDNDEEVDVVTLAMPGATVRDVLDRQMPELEGIDAENVILVVGSNDVIRLTSRENFWEDMNVLFNRLEDYGASVVVVNIPRLADAPAVPSYLRELADYRTMDFNFLIDEAASRYSDVEVFDFYGYSADELADGRDVFSEDRFHPNDEGYRLLGERLLEYL